MFCRSIPKKFIPEAEIPARVLVMQENLKIYLRKSNPKEIILKEKSKLNIAETNK